MKEERAELLRRAERAEAENKRLREELSKMRAALQAECEKLREENVAITEVLWSEKVRRMAEDAARYRWLRKGDSDDVAVVRGLGAMDYGMSSVAYTYSEEIDGKDLDAAIDAALSKENKA